ncbi:type IV pilin N-terminal domain-containing protein [Halolamina sp. CBA1230]|uniref:type IV pilin n=1 Tax=Halolamina sp. CBA1230 TaxID=1853690 RepID=UPI0009A25797|nr:type IV pilin N-terminal domain-containing protein [Halolamina sp. CBA1230]QKY20836.1 type IV pilin N-terminal domain-containing protein [Halolamina sp. CBA1230]
MLPALPSPTDDDRGVSPALGTVLLVGITVAVAALVGATLFGQAAALAGPPPTASFDVTAEGDRITLSHEGGDPADLDALRVEISIDGEEIAHQPPVPFFASEGFHGGPSGAFNPETDDEWAVGETTTLEVAGTNDPTPEPGARLTVELFHGGQRFASLSTQVG